MAEYSEFDINTGAMYSDLGILEDILPREFFYEFERNLEDLLWNKPLDNLMLPFGEEYTDDKLAENNFLSIHQMDPGHRPYTWFFLKPTRVIDGYELVDFAHPYVVDRTVDDSLFDYFFAVKLRLMDIMKVRQFLYYQLEKNFNGKINLFEIFLHDLFIKYNDLINDGKRNIITNKVIEDVRSGAIKIADQEKKETEKSVVGVQVLAMHYLFKAIEPNMQRKDTAKAKFIKMLTGKNFDNIYKAVQNPLATSVGKHRLEEMEIVRKYFMDLGLTKCLDLLNQDFKS